MSKINFVVPAHPGYFVVHPIHEETGEIKEAGREPVVAFAIDEDGCTHPVTLNEIEDRGDPAVLTPEGEVRSYSNTWESIDTWLADMQRTAAREGA